MYPQGASPFGALDMAGNLWEWCLNDYRNPETIDGISNDATKVLRGGSFFSAQFRAACAYRSRYDPNYDGNFYGLRLVVGAPISAL
jgi:formylglycine-generating enzyme required for sulfatase activity